MMLFRSGPVIYHENLCGLYMLLRHRDYLSVNRLVEMSSTTKACGWRAAVKGSNSAYSNGVFCQKNSPITTRPKQSVPVSDNPEIKSKYMQFMDELV